MPGRESGVDPPGGMEPAAAPPGAGRVAVSPASSPSAGFPQLREGSPGCSETSSGIAGVATLLHPRTASSVGSGEAGGGRAAVARGRPGGSAGSGGTEGSPGGGVRPPPAVTPKRGAGGAGYPLNAAPPNSQPEPSRSLTKLPP